MPGKQIDRIKSSGINDIVWNAAKQIRQRMIDTYWLDQLYVHEVALDSKAKKISYRKYKSYPKSKMVVIREKLFKLIVNENGETGFLEEDREEWTPIRWEPTSDQPLPPSKATHEEFAAKTGMTIARYKDLLNQRAWFTIDEVVSIASVGNVDISFMLTPPVEDLELDLLVDVPFPTTSRITMHRWIFWIKGYLPLPEQDPRTYIEEMSLPPLEISAVSDAKNYRKEVFQNESFRRIMSDVAAFEISSLEGHSESGYDYEENPFRGITPQTLSYAPVVGKRLTGEVMNLSAALRVIFTRSIFDPLSKSELILRDNFLGRFQFLHARILFLVKTLRLLRK